MSKIFLTYVLSPKRVKMLLKNNEEGKKLIEKAFGVTLQITREGKITAYAPEDKADVLYRLKDLFDALNLGFKLEDALLLAKDEYLFRTVNLKEFVRPRRQKEDLWRIKSRIIGEKGRAKRLIEELTKTKIVISDEKPEVGIIGPFDRIDLAVEAIRKIANGAPHGRVWQWLEREISMLKITQLETPSLRDLWVLEKRKRKNDN